MQRSIDRTTSRRPSRLIVHRSLIATTSHTISFDGSCHRYSPIVRDSATTRRYRSRYTTAAGDRRKNCRSVAPWSNRNQSYDPEIVRSGVTVTISTHLTNRDINVSKMKLVQQYTILQYIIKIYLTRRTCV